MGGFLKNNKEMDEQDKKLVSRARDIAFLKSYEGWADIHELKKEARSPEARKVIHNILTELNHLEEASAGLL